MTAAAVGVNVEAVLELAARGWHVFPVQAGAKEPRPGWLWKAWNTTDPERIRKWWHQPANAGIACGPSGLVVIDCDVPKPGHRWPPPWDTAPGLVDGADVLAMLCEGHHEPWPATYTVATPSGGLHLYFQAGTHGIGNSARKLAPLIDVRADGGFVVSAGSARPDGAYELIDDCDPAPLPEWLAGLAAAAKEEHQPRRTAAAADHSSAYVRAAVEAEVRNVATAANGQRNDQLNRSAYALARFVTAGELDADVMTRALTAAAQHAGLKPAETRRTIASALKGRQV